MKRDILFLKRLVSVIFPSLYSLFYQAYLEVVLQFRQPFQRIIMSFRLEFVSQVCLSQLKALTSGPLVHLFE